MRTLFSMLQQLSLKLQHLLWGYLFMSYTYELGKAWFRSVLSTFIIGFAYLPYNQQDDPLSEYAIEHYQKRWFFLGAMPMLTEPHSRSIVKPLWRQKKKPDYRKALPKIENAGLVPLRKQMEDILRPERRQWSYCSRLTFWYHGSLRQKKSAKPGNKLSWRSNKNWMGRE